MNDLIGKTNKENNLPEHTNEKELANDFQVFFANKIQLISDTFRDVNASNISLLPDYPTAPFNVFNPVDDKLVDQFFGKMNKTNCPEDPFDIKLFQIEKIRDQLVPIYTDIINSSFHKGKFPDSCKTAVVRPQVKHNKDSNLISSYKPVHNLPFFFLSY